MIFTEVLELDNTVYVANTALLAAAVCQKIYREPTNAVVEFWEDRFADAVRGLPSDRLVAFCFRPTGKDPIQFVTIKR